MFNNENQITENASSFQSPTYHNYGECQFHNRSLTMTQVTWSKSKFTKHHNDNDNDNNDDHALCLCRTIDGDDCRCGPSVAAGIVAVIDAVPTHTSNPKNGRGHLMKMPASETSNVVIHILRGVPPYGIGVIGGFVELGESMESAAIREFGEETGIDLKDEEHKKDRLIQVHTYSDPDQDPRRPAIATIFYLDLRHMSDEIMQHNLLKAGDDAKEIILLAVDELNNEQVLENEWNDIYAFHTHQIFVNDALTQYYDSS